MLESPPSCGAVAQLGERRVRNAKVGSSILLVSTTIDPAVGLTAILHGCLGGRVVHGSQAVRNDFGHLLLPMKKPATSFDVAGLAGTPVAVLAVGVPSEFCPRPSASGPKALAVRPLPGASASPL